MDDVAFVRILAFASKLDLVQKRTASASDKGTDERSARSFGALVVGGGHFVAFTWACSLSTCFYSAATCVSMFVVPIQQRLWYLWRLCQVRMWNQIMRGHCDIV